MAKTQLYFIGASKAKEIRSGGEIIDWSWNNVGDWTSVKSPTKASAKKVKYSKNNKSKAWTSQSAWRAGGVQIPGCSTTVPATESRTIDGVTRTVDVRYRVRGRTEYGKKSGTKQNKITYDNNKHPYYYQKQYRDKPIVSDEYSTYSELDDKRYIYFAALYYDDTDETWKDSPTRLPHPQSYKLTFSDVNKNLDSSANNSSNRDNSGSYVYTNVRANIRTIELEWEGLSEDQGASLLNVLNATNSYEAETNNGMQLTNTYLLVEFWNPQTSAPEIGTFYPSDRAVEYYSQGAFSKISITLTEV